MHITRYVNDYPNVTVHHNSDWSGEAIVSFPGRIWYADGRALSTGVFAEPPCDREGQAVPVCIAAQAVATAVRSRITAAIIASAEDL